MIWYYQVMICLFVPNSKRYKYICTYTQAINQWLSQLIK